MKTVTIFGGSGFVGRSLVRKLIAKNFRVKIITRDVEKSAFLKTFAGPDFLSLIYWDYKNFNQLENLIKGSDAVINLVGILAEKSRQDFENSHANLPKIIAEKCTKHKVEHFVHISALVVQSAAKSKYSLSKLKGEMLVAENFPNAIILRPSIIFGENDSFFNRFAKMLKTSPFLPLINNGATKFQPIYVEDLTEIILQSILNKKHFGKIYEIGGDKIYSFKELLEMLARYMNKRAYFINLSFFQAKLLAFFLEFFTKNVLTRDQVESLKTDNALTNNNFKKDFAIHPKSVEEILPNMLL